jgi:luciferase family oxidoreductase group 1
MIPISLLDLSPIVEGGDASRSFRNSVDLARHAESWGYRRYWLAEHHNMPGIASAATAVVIGHVASATRTIRVGAGGVMLPNHAPLVIAEQFGTLDAMHPGRIDLGLGRAPGTDPRTAHALRRDAIQRADSFPSDVVELLSYLAPSPQNVPVRAIPGAGSNVPVWLLGSSLFSAALAAELGLPFSFASHFAPAHLMAALELYRGRFRPSSTLQKPYAMPAVAVFAAETDAEARRLFTSLEQAFVQLRRGTPGPLRPPLDGAQALTLMSPMEQAMLEHTFAYAVVGSKETVRTGLEAFITETHADELMVTAQIYDHEARLRSFELVSQIFRGV